ncbi:NAD-dependent protein deacetylase sirtuin-1 isoform X2 [Chrysemys picta bellii]|uniref:NAD-dependent protein deacetylase sirtuin-1 isoform X2 n=1 Tax=Chrysemys picta bellii TaxID=8478 RepID=UPI0032B16590
MADETTLLLQPRSGRCAAAEGAEPLPKRQRLDSEDGGGRGSGKGLGPERGVGTAPTTGSATRAAAVRLQGEVAAGWNDGEDGAGLRGLPREEPPPQQQQQGEGAETAPSGDAVETAIGYRRSQCSHGSAEAAAPHPDDILFSDEIIANGFHSCDSDEDDRASRASSSDWTPRPRIGPYTFVQQHLMIGTDPRTILKDLLPETIPPPELDDMTLWQIVINILSEPPKRKKRKDINTIEDAVKLLQECKKIIVLTGAGEIYPGQFQPSLCHKFIALMDKEGKLLRNYTQNIDTLEQVAGIQRIIQCHGSFATASCLICKYKVDCEAVRGDIFNQVVPRCPRCPPDEPLAIMKPEIVFFGENLPEQFHRAMKYDKDEVDLLIVIGSSLKVRPVALIPSSIPHEVPQILINREPLPHLHFDVELLGDCDVIINELCQRLGGEYTKLCYNSVKLSEITEKPSRMHKEFEMHSAELPPTPLKVSEDSSSPNRMTPPDPLVVLSEHPTEGQAENADPSSESKGNCMEDKLQEVQACSENSESITGQLMNSEHMKDNRSNKEENKEKNEITSSVETLRKCLANRFAKEQISKRLDGTQYLFLPPNRYIFHGAEVYSDSEDDVLSSSSCGSSSDSGSCHSPSLDVEDESEIEEFYNGMEEEDAPEREEETGFGEDGIVQDAVGEPAYINEAAGIDRPSNKL